MRDFLKDVVVLDFTHRLPGPMASYVLSGLGARVTKIEDQRFGDAFSKGAFAQMEESFPSWYRELNQNKRILSLDFDAAETPPLIRELLLKADVVIMGPPPKVRAKLGLTRENLEEAAVNSGRPLVVAELLASRQGPEALHDVNALGLAGLLPLHLVGRTEAVVAPPFLPVAGIGFGHHVATTLLAALHKAHSTKRPEFVDCYLLDSTRELFSPFWPEDIRQKGMTRFLHNGRYPCYNIYRLADGHYATLAAVEEKFWVQLCQRLGLDLTAEDRFHHEDSRVFDKLSQAFGRMSSQDVHNLSAQEEVCLSLVE